MKFILFEGGPMNLVLSFVFFLFSSIVFAQSNTPSSIADYPNRPIRLIVTTAAGGGSDAVARPLEKQLSGILKQPVVIDNRPGASGMIAMEMGARAAPDGYTLIFATVGTVASNYALHEKISYDPIKDFTPITRIADTHFVFLINPKLGVNSLDEFVALAKSRSSSNQLTFASYGVGSYAQLLTEWFSSIAGIKMIHVPYKGSSPAMTDLISGQVDCIIDTLPSSMPFIQSKKVKALAISGDKRGEGVTADIPTFKELSYGEFKPIGWWGLLAPANTPRPIVMKLNEAFHKALFSEEIAERFKLLSAVPVGNSPEEFAKQIKEEVDIYVKVARKANIKADQ